MSNTAVGGVYQTIIDEVINSSRVDFEESGVEEAVLEELRKGWQQKLSQLDVATFPWDPKPEPPPPAKAAPAPAPTHSQAQFTPQLPPSNAAVAGGVGQNGMKPESSYIKQENGQAIKQEPGTQPGGLAPYPGYNANMNDKNSVAASRAAQQLHAQYGNRAAGSISAIQDRISQQPPPQVPGQIQPQAQQQGYRPSVPNPAAQQQPPSGPAPHIRNGQTDGPADFDSDSDEDDDDFEGVLLQRNAEGNLNELGRMDIDRILHKRMAAKAKSMEAGGLMLTLKEATKDQSSAAQVSSYKKKGKGKGVARFDGGDDDEEDDEDAINSDLDDPEDDHDDDEVDDEGLGHIMLCMYDKVQRVKNKWKCTLKDGVLTVNGKEYVFHKATGEYEW